jgi:hypothetical protein
MLCHNSSSLRKISIWAPHGASWHIHSWEVQFCATKKDPAQPGACMNPPTRPCWEIFSVGNRSAPWLHSGSFVRSPWLGRTFIELIPCWFPARWIYHLRIYFYQSFIVLLGCWGNCGQTYQLHSLYWARRPRWKDLALWNCCHGQISLPWSSRSTFTVWILHVFFFTVICLIYECGLG